MIIHIVAPFLFASLPVTTSAPLPRLVLQQPAPLAPSASLLKNEQPPNSSSLKHEVGSSPEAQMAQTNGDFFRLPSCRGRHGSCDNSGDFALLAGIVGFFVGFGVGHLITGNITGFVIWLLIDLLVVGVFFIALPASAFASWYWVSIAALLVDRTVEAFSAAASATRDHYVENALPPERDVLNGGPAPQFARLLTVHY